MGIIVPPGGFAGASQMTPASRASWGTKAGGGTRKRRRRTKKAKRKTAKRRASKSPKFGTAAYRAKYGNGKRKKRKK